MVGAAPFTILTPHSSTRLVESSNALEAPDQGLSHAGYFAAADAHHDIDRPKGLGAAPGTCNERRRDPPLVKDSSAS